MGWDHKYTVAVWVGYPEPASISMSTDFDGGPVEGGTYPALIWQDFLIGAIQIDRERAERNAAGKAHSGGTGEELPPATGCLLARAVELRRRGANEGASRPPRRARLRATGNGGNGGGISACAAA